MRTARFAMRDALYDASIPAQTIEAVAQAVLKQIDRGSYRCKYSEIGWVY